MSTGFLSPVTMIIQAFSDAGVPLNGGTVTTYVGGSVNTPLTTYTDATLTVQNANPLTLQANGRPTTQFWTPSGALLKYVLSDSGGNQLSTLDNLPAINDLSSLAGGATLTSLVVGPPVSGDAGLFTGLGGGGRALLAMVNADGESFRTGRLTGTNNPYMKVSFTDSTAATTLDFDSVAGLPELLLQTSGVTRIKVDGVGGITFSNPLVGTTLMIDGQNSTSYTFDATAATSGYAVKYIINDTGFLIQHNSSARTLELGVNSTSYFKILGAGNLVNVAPTSGYGLTIHQGISTDALTTALPAPITASTYAHLITDFSLIFNASGTCTVTLLAAASYTGKLVLLRTIASQTVVSASNNVIALAGGSAGSAILAATAGKWALLQSDGTNWQIMMSN